MHDPGPQGLLYLNLHRAENLAPFALEAQRSLLYIFYNCIDTIHAQLLVNFPSVIIYTYDVFFSKVVLVYFFTAGDWLCSNAGQFSLVLLVYASFVSVPEP